jgi:hypothetical protein
MFMLILFCFVLNKTVMMREALAYHPMRALCAVLDRLSIRATPSVCGAFSSSWPENSSLSCGQTLLSTSCPLWFTNFKDIKVKRSYLHSNLSCFSCFVHGPNIPCSDVDGCPGWKNGHRLSVFLSAFTTPRPMYSNWRFSFSQGRVGFWFSILGFRS